MIAARRSGAVWAGSAHASPDDLAACRALLADGSRTFLAASHLLPPDVRSAATALYAFCRLADDACDLSDDHRAAMDAMRGRLARIYDGTPADHPVDRALADVIAIYAMPRTLPEALFEGFEWDAEGRRYETLADLEAYAARVAGTVGGMMAILMGARDPLVVARACDLGVAMQLTNIARDVGEDARAGRVYLPLTWLRAAGIDPDAWLMAPRFSPELGTVVRRLLDRADRLYRRAEMGIGQLPWRCRSGILAARLLYAEIGQELRRRGADSVGVRTVVPLSRKLTLIAQAATRSLAAPALESLPPLDANRYLVEAVAPPPLRVLVAEDDLSAGPRGRVGWVLDLFEQLERRDLMGSASGSASSPGAT